MQLTLRKYQQDAIDWGSLRSFILADECGLGKTITSIGLIEQRDLKNVLIIAPKKLREQWVQEFIVASSRAVIVIGKGKNELQTVPLEKGWYVTHYAFAMRNWEVFMDRVWDVIILDEAHRIKNRAAKTTKAIKRLNAFKRVALTGTPIETSPADLWSLLNWIDPGEFPGYHGFFKRYVETKPGFRNYPIIVGPRNMKEMAVLTKPYYLKRTKKQVAPELPDLVEQIVPVMMTPAQERDYRLIEKSEDVLVQLREDQDPLFIENALTHIVRLQQISSYPPILGSEAKSGKMEWVKEWVANNPGEPVVFFTRFRMTAMILTENLEKWTKHRPSMLVGSRGGKTDTARFFNGETPYIVGTIASMGEGLNLQRADYGIFVDQEYSATKMTQAINRIHRMNITSTKFVYYLESAKVDRNIIKAFKNKWSMSAMVNSYLNT